MMAMAQEEEFKDSLKALQLYKSASELFSKSDYFNCCHGNYFQI